MKKRALIVISISLVVVIVVAISALSGLFSGPKEEEKGSDVKISSQEILRTVPVDAIALLCFEKRGDLIDMFTAESSLTGGLIDKGSLIANLAMLPGSQGPTDLFCSVISFHYSAKNEVSPLLIKYIDGDGERDSILELLKKEGAVKKRRYNGFDIYSVGAIHVTFHNGMVLASGSAILLESSIRHIASGSSILDNEDFVTSMKGVKMRQSFVFVNNANIGKLFSGVVNRRYWGVADYCSSLANWCVAQGSQDSTFLHYKGFFSNLRGVANFSTIYGLKSGEESKVWTLLPYNTYALVSFSVASAQSYFDAYSQHQELKKRLNRERAESSAKWFSSMNLGEVAVALIPYGSGLEWITLLKKDREGIISRVKRSLFGRDEDSVRIKSFDHRGDLTFLFGKIFSYTNEESILSLDEWYVIGPDDILKMIDKSGFGSLSLAEFIDECGASKVVGDKRYLVNLFVNSSHNSDSLALLFRPEVRNYIGSALKKSNVEFLNVSVEAGERDVEFEIRALKRSVAKLPEPKIEDIKARSGWEQDTIVEVPAGPYKLKDIGKGGGGYLVQLPSMWLQLCDKNMKGIWAVPFETPIRGYVEQVDFFNNNKLQMFFASGNKLYLLDRLGRFVNGFPRGVDSLIMIGPKVYDLGRDDYAFMLLHTDNRLRLYDKDCRIYPRWSDIRTKELIKSFPELIKVGANRYWVLRTSLSTYFYTINGILINKSNKKVIIRPDTKIEKLTGSEVSVTAYGDKRYSLNLENGKIRAVKD